MNTEVISLVLNFILGGGLLTVITVKSLRKKADGDASQSVAQAKVIEAQAENQQIENMTKIAEAWEKQTAALEERLKFKDEQHDAISRQMTELSAKVESLTKEVASWRKLTKRMVDLIDKVTPDTLEETKQTIKQLHDESK